MANQIGNFIFSLFIIIQLANQVSSQVAFFGRCPPVVPKQNFNPQMFTNKTWYLIEKYPIYSEIASKCNLIRFSFNSDLTLTVYTQHIQPVTGFIEELNGKAYPENYLIPEGRYYITYETAPFQKTMQYIILDTDYTNYAVMYSCVDYSFFHLRYAWIYTGDRTPNPEYLATANTVLYNNGLDTVRYLKRTDQSNCYDFGTV